MLSMQTSRKYVRKMEVELHTLLTWTLNACEWSVGRFYRFTPDVSPGGTQSQSECFGEKTLRTGESEQTENPKTPRNIRTVYKICRQNTHSVITDTDEHLKHQQVECK